MKKTRNLLVLTGKPNEVQEALDAIKFKALTVFKDCKISSENILDVFNCNKSVVCKDFNLSDIQTPKIPIAVIKNSNGILPNQDYIDLSKDVSQQLENIAVKHNLDIGDRKSNSSGLTGAPSIADCAYCKYLNHTSTDYIKRTVYESENFFVIPTIGQFIKGYLLIIPKAHVMSMAEFNNKLMDEFNSVLDDVCTILKLTYNYSKLLVWENGTGNSGKGKAKDSIVHCHVHVAPSNLTADIIEGKSIFPLIPISTCNIKDYSKYSYLLIKDGLDKWRINYKPEVYIPRQYVRQLLAEEYSIPGEQWNWREYPFKNLLLETVNDILTAIKENWDNLSPRIKQNTKNFINF